MAAYNKNKLILRKKLGIYGKRDLVLHHIDVELKYYDPIRYNEWREDDVVVMTRSEHSKLHRSLKNEHEIERARKSGLAHRGKSYIRTDETKRKMSEAMKGNKVAKGRKWYNNGIISVMQFECPEGFKPGRIK